MDAILEAIHELTRYLKKNHLTIVSAESCTAGLVAGWLTELPGSSTWFEQGFITYSNQAKHTMLDVDEGLIRENGAVSEVVAEAMAKGALTHSQSSIAVAVTGIAGPGGGTPEKPVGTVCFAWALRDKAIKSERCYFTDLSRQQIRQHACLYLIKKTLFFLKNFEF